MINEIIDGEVRKVNRELQTNKQIKKFIVRDEEFQKTTTQKIKRFTVSTQGK
jgi:long-chain acyl-CoA synthetase